MKLIPREIEAILPPLYSQENVADPIAVVKFFDPCGRYLLRSGSATRAGR
jgi:hypothetical protein